MMRLNPEEKQRLNHRQIDPTGGGKGHFARDGPAFVYARIHTNDLHFPHIHTNDSPETTPLHFQIANPRGVYIF